MSLIEEISTKQSRGVKRQSLISDTIESNESKKNGRKSRSTTQNSKINYNLAALEAAAHGLNQEDEYIMSKKERSVQKRMQELDRENYNEQHLSRFELPKNLILQQQMLRNQTATVKKILNSKKQLNNYLDENEAVLMKRIWNKLEATEDLESKLVICSICGNNAKYRCVRCETRYCSIKCGDLHNETRCSSYVG